MIILVLFADLPEPAVNVLISICGAVILLSLILYGRFYRKILLQTPQEEMIRAGKIVLALIWAGIIVICFVNRKSVSVDGILQYTPENPWLAAGAMLCLFALKSLSVVIYSGILYVVSGILFPIPAAITVNILGSVIMLSLPYLIGKKAGASIIKRIRDKYPKTEILHELRKKNDVFFCFTARIMRIPSDVVSLYMGAVQVDYRKYLLGSMLGTIPHTITYPIMGMSVSDISSPQFILAFCAEVIYFAVTAVIYVLYTKKRSK